MALTGNEICSNCKTAPFPRGYESTLGTCWFCTFPRRPLPLTDEQRELIAASWGKEV